MTNQMPRSLWLPHRAFSPLSNCLITRHRLFAKSKSKLNRRLKLALTKLAMILIIMIERVGRGSSTLAQAEPELAEQAARSQVQVAGEEEDNNLFSSLVSSLPPRRIVVISSLGLSVCAQLLSLPIEMGATNRREILEHSSGWRRKRNCSRMGHAEQGGRRA